MIERILMGAMAGRFESSQRAIESAVEELHAALLEKSDGPEEKYLVHQHIAGVLRLLAQVVGLSTEGGDAAVDELGNVFERVRQSRLQCHQELRASREATAAQNRWRNERLTAVGYPGQSLKDDLVVFLG